MHNKYVQSQQLLEEYKKALLEAMKLNIEIPKNLASIYTTQMQESIKAMNQEITQNLSAGLSEYVRLTMHESFRIKLDMANIIRDTFKNIDFEKLESELSSDKLFTDDYVTFDESTVKEFDISETVAIPLGNNRVRMKTSDFIALLALIATVIGFIYNAAVERLDAASNNATTEKLIEIAEERKQLELERNQTLNKILTTVDYSNSSNQEYLEELNESLLGLQSEFSELQDTVQSLGSTVRDSDFLSQIQESAPDNHSETIDNMNESSCTESEN